MKSLLTAVFAALLFTLNPVIAQTQTNQECVTEQKVMEFAPEAEKIVLAGQDLEAFMSAIEATFGTKPDPVEKLVFVKLDPQEWALIVLDGGCVVQVAPADPEIVQHLLSLAKRFRVENGA